MPVDFTTPIAFSSSAAIICWLTIETLVKPILEEFGWWNQLSDQLRSVIWKLAILAVLIPWGLCVFGPTEEVILTSLGAVLQATGLYSEVKRRSPRLDIPTDRTLTQEGGIDDVG